MIFVFTRENFDVLKLEIVRAFCGALEGFVRAALTNSQFWFTYQSVGMTNRTEREWPETKRRLVDAGVSLMRARGFNATSLDDICAAAGVTKGGLFHYFKSKEEIAKAAIATFAEGKVRDFQNAAFRKLADPLDRVFGRLDFAIESTGATRLTKGCLIGMLAQELSFTNSELRRVCQDSFLRIAEDFEKDLAEAKALHAPKAAFDPKKLATLYVTIVQGSIIMAKTAENNAAIKENLEQLRHYIQFLFGGTHKSARGKLSGSARN
jgi:TetR/AcrR family transcriptional repressor of nem operon